MVAPGLDAVPRALDRCAVAIAPPIGDGSVTAVDDTLNSLHLIVLATLFIGASDAQEIAARLGLDVDDVTVLLAELERAGAIVTGER